MTGNLIPFPTKRRCRRPAKLLVEAVISLPESDEIPWAGDISSKVINGDMVVFGTQKESGTYLLLWHDGVRYVLTRFDQGHEQGSYSFDKRDEAIERAEICNRLCHIDVEITRRL